jgi:hypothetical protein
MQRPVNAPEFPSDLIEEMHTYLCTLPDSTSDSYNAAAQSFSRGLSYFYEAELAVKELLHASGDTIHSRAIRVLSCLENATGNGVCTPRLHDLCHDACRNAVLRCASSVIVRLWQALNDPVQPEVCRAVDGEAGVCEEALELLTWESGYHKTSVQAGLREQRERYRKKFQGS